MGEVYRPYDQRAYLEIFGENALKKNLCPPYQQYLETVHRCGSERGALAKDLLVAVAPLCIPHLTRTYRQVIRRDPQRSGLYFAEIEESEERKLSFAWVRGGDSLSYFLGQPKYGDAVTKVWRQHLSVPNDVGTSPLAQRVISKLQLDPDADIVLPVNLYEYDRDDLIKVVADKVGRVCPSASAIALPAEVRRQSSRYLSPNARTYSDGNSHVIIGESQRKTTEMKNIIIDMYKGDDLMLRLDLFPIDPQAFLFNDFRIGPWGPRLDNAVRHSLIIDEEGQLNVAFNPYIFNYIHLGHQFNQTWTHSSFTHALSGMLREIDTFIYFSENIFPEDRFQMLKYRIEGSTYHDFDMWRLIFGRGLTPEMKLKRYQEESVKLAQRAEEITFFTLRGMTRNPFLFLAMASGLHLLTHLSKGPELFEDNFIPEIVRMARMICPENDWNKKIKSVDDLWNELPELTQLYEERVLGKPECILEDTGAFMFARAVNDYSSTNIDHPVNLTPEGLVSLFSPLDKDGNPRHFFFPKP